MTPLNVALPTILLSLEFCKIPSEITFNSETSVVCGILIFMLAALVAALISLPVNILLAMSEGSTA